MLHWGAASHIPVSSLLQGEKKRSNVKKDEKKINRKSEILRRNKELRPWIMSWLDSLHNLGIEIWAREVLTQQRKQL